MHKLLEKLDKELHKYADKEGELTKQEWDVVFSAIEARKDLLTSMAMEGEDQYGNYDDYEMSSGRYPYYNGGSYRGRGRSMMMDPDLSYTPSRGSYRSMNRGTRRSGNYSGHGGNEMIDNLYMALDQAQSEEERRSIKAIIDKFEC